MRLRYVKKESMVRNVSIDDLKWLSCMRKTALHAMKSDGCRIGTGEVTNHVWTRPHGIAR